MTLGSKSQMSEDKEEKMKKLLLTVALMGGCLFFTYAQTEKTEKLELSLVDCIRTTLENNLDIKVQAFNPELNDVTVRQEKEIFLPRLNFGYQNRNSNSVGSWWLEGTNYKQDLSQISFWLNEKIVTGGDLTLYYYNTTTDSTRKFNSINPVYNNYVQLMFNQPLLKNFGPRVNRYNIKRAQNTRDISILDLNNTINDKMYEVERAYWSLVRYSENLAVNQLSLEQSLQRLKNTREAARVGTKGSTDILSAETEVVNYEGQVLNARAQVETYGDQLKALLNLPPDGLESLKSIVPLDRPVLEKPTVSLEEALEISLANNPQMVRIVKELENSDLTIRYHRNQLLPQLDLNFNLSYFGQGGVRFLYQNDNALTGIIVGQEETTRWDAFKEILNGKYPDFRLGLTLSIPFENVFSRTGLAKAKLEEEKSLVEKERQEKAIYYELLQIFKSLRNGEKSIESAKRYREMMEKKVDVEEERYRLGLVQSSEWLFTYQSQLTNAKSGEIQAMIDYKITVAQLEKVMGISLDKKNLTFEGYDF
jgi:outer membrane protein TolC